MIHLMKNPSEGKNQTNMSSFKRTLGTPIAYVHAFLFRLSDLLVAAVLQYPHARGEPHPDLAAGCSRVHPRLDHTHQQQR